MRQILLCIVTAMLTMATVGAPAAFAEEGVIAGVDLGFAQPVDKFNDRANLGGVISPFGGYMFNNYLGLMGQAQVAGMPNEDRPGVKDSAATWPLGVHAGPRVALPLFKVVELYGTWQAGVFTGLSGNTPISRTSWGQSMGGGLNFRISDEFLLGVFGRYNWLDQHIEDQNVKYVTAGFSLTYNLLPPPPPPPVARAAPPPAPPPAKKKIVLRGVHFDFNKATIRPDARPVLDEAIATLKHEGGVAVIAEGHTDSVGSEAYNMGLSVRRANAVRDYLIAGGIAPSRIRAEGFGESHPVASNDTADGRAQNRRVELRVR